MKTRNIFFAIFFIAALTACRKNNATDNNTNTTPKQLTYTGTADILSEGRYEIQLKQTGNYTCFTGGEYFLLLPFGGKPSSNTDVYNHQTGAWNRFGMSVLRDGYAAAALNNRLLIAGGYSAGSGYSDVVDIFDLGTNQVTVKKLSQARNFLTAAGAGNKILFAGGYATNKVSAAVDIYNTQTGQLTIDSLSLARHSLCAGAAGNKIVFAGGKIFNGTLTDRADIYDVQTGQWTQATLSQPRANMEVISAGSKIFFAGGEIFGGYSENVDVYDVLTNRWTVTPLSGNTLRVLLACTNGSQVFFASGSNYNYTKVHIYDLNTGQLNTVPLPAPQRSSSMAAAYNKLVIAVGVTADTVTKRVLVYDTKTGMFDGSSFSLPEKKGITKAAAAGNKILIAGGIWDGPNAANQREVINYKTVSVFELK